MITILAGGQESAIDINDLEVKNDFTFIKAAENGTTQTTLALEELAKSNPTITFIHKYPGFVNSGVIDRLLATAPALHSSFAPVALQDTDRWREDFGRWGRVTLAGGSAPVVQVVAAGCLRRVIK